MHILYVHWSGYVIFKVKEFEEIGSLIKSVRKSYDDIKMFSGIIKNEAFYPFSDPNEAFENWRYIMKENKIPPTLRKFVIKFGVKNIRSLGIEYTNLIDDFRNSFGMTVLNNTGVMEIIRSIKYHISTVLKKEKAFPEDKLFLKALTHKAVDGDAISGSSGINITNHYNLLKDMEKTINLKSTKLRQLIRPFFPELRSISIVTDEELPVFASIYFDDEITDKWTQLKTALGEPRSSILKSAIYTTIGREICSIDSNLMKDCAFDLLDVINRYKDCKLITYNATKKVAPNLTKLLELSSNDDDKMVDLSATEIIAKAGSLKKLAEKSSTAIHTQNKKNDTLLRRTKTSTDMRSADDKLRSARIKSLTDKCALAARRDYFGGQDADKTLDDTFGEQCYKNHVLKMTTWANKRAITIGNKNKDDLIQRVKKFKLKRKEKKKVWRQKKNNIQKDVLYGNTINVDMED